MAKLKILVWEKGDTTGEPEVEVTIPTYLIKWAPKMMKIMPKKAKQDLWGEDFDLNELNLDELITEAIEKGESEIMEVKARDAYIKIYIEQ